MNDGDVSGAALVLAFGVALCAICLLVFLVWKSGPCHRSRLIQKCYIIFVWILFIMSIAFAFFVSGSEWRVESTQEGLVRAAIIALIISVASSGIMPLPPPQFDADALNTTQSARATPRARRVSMLLQDVLRESHEDRRKSKAQVGRLVIVLLILMEAFAEGRVLRILARVFIVVEFVRQLRRFFTGCALELSIRPRCSRMVHDIFKEALPKLVAGELEYVFVAVNMAQVLELAPWGTLEFLCRQSSELLTPVSTAVLLDALMKRTPGSMRWNPGLQRLVKSLITNMEGRKLTLMKNAVDSAGGCFSFHHLVYHTITNASIRAELLRHIKTEAAALNIAQERLLKVLSDVDDTLVCGARFPAGCDTRFPRHTVYPGVSTLFAKLDRLPAGYPELVVQYKEADKRNPADDIEQKQNSPFGEQPEWHAAEQDAQADGTQDGENDDMQPMLQTWPRASLACLVQRAYIGEPQAEYGSHGSKSTASTCRCTSGCSCSSMVRVSLAPTQANLVFLSARPNVYKDTTFSKLRGLARNGQLHVEPQLLSGSLRSGLRAVLTYPCLRSASWRNVGLRKKAAFEEYAQLYPEYEFVFFGDNGQGDVLAAEHMLDGPYGHKVRAVFVHEVKARGSMLTSKPRCSHTAGHEKIHFHFTYVKAALDALGLGLLDADGLHAVASNACSQLKDMHILHRRWKWKQATMQLNADLRAANAVLAPHRQVPEAPLFNGASVSSIFSAAKVCPDAEP